MSNTASEQTDSHMEGYVYQTVRNHLLEMDRHEAEREFHDWGLTPEDLTDTALSLSLCPLHLVDYAICFDDNRTACWAIRVVHPAHDT